MTRHCTSCATGIAVVLETDHGEQWLCGPCWMSYLLAPESAPMPPGTALGTPPPVAVPCSPPPVTALGTPPPVAVPCSPPPVTALDTALPLTVTAQLREQVEPGWVHQAVCAQIGPDLFDTDLATAEQLRRSRTVCLDCPVQASCLAASLLREESGLWAGTVETDRAAARAELATGRPVAEVLARYTPDSGNEVAA